MTNDYKLAKITGVVRSDGANIPNADDNADWREYQRWLAKGNTSDPADPEPVEPALVTIEKLEHKEQLPRLVRDLIKDSMASKAQAMGVTLPQLYAAASAPSPPQAAISWKKFKDFDDQIAELRKRI